MDVDSTEDLNQTGAQGEEGSSSAENTPAVKHKEPKKRFEVKKVGSLALDKRFGRHSTRTTNQFNAVALWAWDIVVDNCAICRNHIMDLCMCFIYGKGSKGH